MRRTPIEGIVLERNVHVLMTRRVNANPGDEDRRFVISKTNLTTINATHVCILRLLPQLSSPLLRLSLSNRYGEAPLEQPLLLTGLQVLRIKHDGYNLFLHCQNSFATLKYLEMGPVSGVMPQDFLYPCSGVTTILIF